MGKITWEYINMSLIIGAIKRILTLIIGAIEVFIALNIRANNSKH